VTRPAAQLRLGGQGLQLHLDLLRQRLLRRRPRVRRAPGHRRRDHAAGRRRHRRRGPAPGLVQRYLTCATSDVTPDGVPLTQRFRHPVAAGLAPASAGLALDAAVQYSPRSSARCAPSSARATRPAPFRTCQRHLPLTRGLSEQLELGWQWPWKSVAPARPGQGRRQLRRHLVRGGPRQLQPEGQPHHRFACSASSTTPAAGSPASWPSALSTGRSEATTRLLLQLELVGLSRSGFQPAQGLEGQYPRLPPAARRAAQRPTSTDPSAQPDMNEPCTARASRPWWPLLPCARPLLPRQVPRPPPRAPATTSPPSSTRSWSPPVEVEPPHRPGAGRGRARRPAPAARQPSCAQALDALIEERVMITHARDSGVRVDDAEIDRAVQSIARRTRSHRRAAARLGRRHRLARFRANLRDQIMIERVREREVYQRIRITDEDIDRCSRAARLAPRPRRRTTSRRSWSPLPEGASMPRSEARAGACRAGAGPGARRRGLRQPWPASSPKTATAPRAARSACAGRSRLPDAFVEAVRRWRGRSRTGAAAHRGRLSRAQAGRTAEGRCAAGHADARPHILLRTVAAAARSRRRRRLAEYKRQIIAAASFEDMARQFSEDGSAAAAATWAGLRRGSSCPSSRTAMNRSCRWAAFRRPWCRASACT
jgi:hypothetical protein